MARFGLSLAVAITAALLAMPALYAAEVAGVRIEDQARAGGADLVLNGAGLRKKVFFKVYVAALYVSKKTSAASAVIDAPEPRRVVLHLLRDLEADALFGALMDGLRNNHGEVELAAMKGDIDQFERLMRGIGNARSGDVIALDFGAATQVGFNGQPRGSIPGEAFGRALLKIWLGDKPVDPSLKQALLGG